MSIGERVDGSRSVYEDVRVESPRPAEAFATTHWSVVLSARGESRPEANEALARLCQTYWPPLYAFLRRRGSSAHDAEDLVQSFFERFLADDFLGQVQQEKGRFRSFLLAALRHHAANQHRHQQTQRRGGARVHASLEEPGVLERCDAALATGLEPERVFDRVWAETVLAQAAAQVRLEYLTAGKGALYEGLRPWLAAEPKACEYAAAAPSLGLSEGALAVAVHRLRQRFRQAVRAQVAHTVQAPPDIDEEMRYLRRVLVDP